MKKVTFIVTVACLLNSIEGLNAQEAKKSKFKISSINATGSYGLENSNNANYASLLGRANINGDALGDLSKYAVDYNGTIGPENVNFQTASILLGFKPLQKSTNTYFENRELFAGITYGQRQTSIAFPSLSNYHKSDTTYTSSLNYIEYSRSLGVESFYRFQSKQIKLFSIFTGVGMSLAGFFDNKLSRGILTDSTISIDIGNKKFINESHHYSEKTFNSSKSLKSSIILPLGVSIQLGKKLPVYCTLEARVRIAYQHYFIGKAPSEISTAIESAIGVKYNFGQL